jgi:hypothetical protein
MVLRSVWVLPEKEKLRSTARGKIILRMRLILVNAQNKRKWV